MSTVIIKQPNLRKLREEQRKLLSTIAQPINPASTYIASPMASVSNVYHSRHTLLLVKGQNDSETRECSGACVAGDDESAQHQRPLLSDILNAAPRLNLDVEKTLSLTCKVLAKARTQLHDLSDEARQSLGRITEFGNSLAILLPQEEAGGS